MYRNFLIVILVIFLSSCEKTPDLSDGEMKYYGDSFEDIGYSIAQVDNGYIIGGQFTILTRDGKYIDKDSSKTKMAVIRTGKDGNTIWKGTSESRYPAVGSKILALEDGSSVCTGYVTDTQSPFQKHLLIVKFDAEGNKLLEKVFKRSGNQYGTDIIQTPEGFLIIGSTDVKKDGTDYNGNPAGKRNVLIARLNNVLDTIGSIGSEGFTGNDDGVAIKADINEGYVVIGTTDRSDVAPLAGNNIILWKLRSDGSVIESRILGSSSDENASDIEVLSDGYLAVGNYINTVANRQEGYVWKIPANIKDGSISGHKLDIGLPSTDKTLISIKAMCRYKSSSFLLAGQFGTGLSARMLIIATDVDGYMLEGKKKIIGGTGTQVANDIISDVEGNIVVIGKNSYENNSMITLYKFRF